MTVTVDLLPADAAGLIFDCDGTVLDTMSAHWASWDVSCQKFGIAMTPQQFLHFAGKPGPEIVRILCQEQGLTGIDFDAFIAYKRTHFEASLSQVKPIAAVLAIAQEGQRRGLPMAVASGGGHKHVREGLRVNGLEGMFKAIVCAEDYVNSKPAPDCFLLAAQQIGVAPELCVGYEDAMLGLEAIKAAGFLAGIDVRDVPGYPQLVC
mmetsp:Transcript_15623/g.47124  ORF Transcript_15623/g.47124 Transcript_15623/m.47124 type:complete len:207 (-) Transcript_15623:712-1332(-)